MREKLIEILRKPIFPHELADPTEAVADYLLDNGVTVQQWTPVTQRVPESHLEQWEDIDGTHYTVISDFVLGYTAEGEMIVVQHEVGDERDWWIDCNGGDYTITHWMPLPGKPEVEK